VNRRRLISLAWGASALASLPAIAATSLPQVEVFKNPSCGCCGAWADHLKAAGFPVRFGSCHTATVGSYTLEGHVPADEVKRLLALKPKAVGLAVPSMPPGSPGMEMGARKDPYNVFLIDKSGHETVFAAYPKA